MSGLRTVDVATLKAARAERQRLEIYNREMQSKLNYAKGEEAKMLSKIFFVSNVASKIEEVQMQKRAFLQEKERALARQRAEIARTRQDKKQKKSEHQEIMYRHQEMKKLQHQQMKSVSILPRIVTCIPSPSSFRRKLNFPDENKLKVAKLSTIASKKEQLGKSLAKELEQEATIIARNIQKAKILEETEKRFKDRLFKETLIHQDCLSRLEKVIGVS